MLRLSAAALCAALALTFAPSSLEVVPAHCATAKTYSQARNGCVRNCPRPHAPQCRQFCTSAFNDCMATGTFPSKWCGPMHGLQKR